MTTLTTIYFAKDTQGKIHGPYTRQRWAEQALAGRPGSLHSCQTIWTPGGIELAFLNTFGAEAAANWRRIGPKVTRYEFGNTPGLVPIGADWRDCDDATIVSAGFDPDDPELTSTELTDDWNGHLRGALVLAGLTVEGHPFAIVD